MMGIGQVVSMNADILKHTDEHTWSVNESNGIMTIEVYVGLETAKHLNQARELFSEA